ncbi:MAG: ErfK/YbiS/YcfS/YnhG [Hyphomicrobiales bacterium]|nr:ErfK/YbiS/YcfS/YnhG [Hyphomicrobiales bacterium]
MVSGATLAPFRCRGSLARIAATLGLSCMIFPGFVSAQAADTVSFDSRVAPGTIVVRTGERRLYLVISPGHALRYRVGVGRAGRQWAGVSSIDGKFIRPDWAPPLAVKRDHPGLPDVVPAGSPSNPLGAAALTLSGGEYAIHGTNAPESIGRFVSYGCIRMSNKDIVDLSLHVNLGTPVVVVR